jgi:DNA-binding NarL/FixJ family response regulator
VPDRGPIDPGLPDPRPPNPVSDPIRVLICDDHALFRRGLLMVIEDEDDLEVVAEAANGRDAIELAAEYAPDVVLMDLRMPHVDGIAATRAILERQPSAAVILLTVSDDEEDLFEAMKVGAAGYLLKEISIDEVGSAIRSVHRGERLVTPSLATKLITEFASIGRSVSTGNRVAANTPQLTARELDVLRQVASGKSNRDIATALGIAENTVKNHVRNMLEKLRLHSRMEAVLYAVREKLVEL